MLSKKAIDAIKAKPLEDRVKTQTTVTEPRVLCVSVFDNGPVHMLDTIHTSAGIITIVVAASQLRAHDRGERGPASPPGDTNRWSMGRGRE